VGPSRGGKALLSPKSVQNRMHPPLTVAKHPLCVEVIAALQACHSGHPWAKLVGHCNDQKWALDACFKAEARRRNEAVSRGVASADTTHWLVVFAAQKQVKRKKNFEKAKAFQARYQAERAAAAAAKAAE
jgi:COX assembly protein 2